MKTSTINKLTALLTASGILSIAPLTVTAQSYKYVTTSTSEAGQSYFSSTSPGYAALQVNGAGGNVVYTGNDINASGTGNANNNGKFGLYAYNAATVLLTGGTIVSSNTVASAYAVYVATSSTFSAVNTTIISGIADPDATYGNAHGIYVIGTSAASGANLTIRTYGQSGNGIRIVTDSQFTGTGLDIATTGSGANGIYVNGTASRFSGTGLTITTQGQSASGVYVTNTAQAVVRDAVIETFGDVGRGIVSTAGANLEGSDLTVTTHGSTAYGLYLQEGEYVNLNRVVVNTDGDDSRGIYFNQVLSSTLTHFQITTTGSESVGIAYNGHADDAVDNVTLTISSGTIETGGENAYGITMAGHNAHTLTVTDVKIHTTGEGTSAFNITSGTNGYKVAVFNNATLQADHGDGIQVNKIAIGSYSVEQLLARSGTYDITLNNSAVSGSNAIEIDCYRSGTDANGDTQWVNMPVHSTITANNSVFTGDLVQTGSAQHSEVNFRNSSTLTGNIITNDNAALTVNLDNSTFIGASTVNDTAATHLTLNNSAWNLTGKSKVTTLTSSGGSITIANVQGDDLTVSNGITGQTALHLTLSDGVKDQTEIRVVVDETNAMLGERFTLGSEVSNGMYDYVLENKTDGAWLIYTAPDPVDPIDPIDPTPPVAPIISAEGDAVLNTAAAVAGFWFTQLDNLHKRMGELRYNKPAGGDVLDNVWVRAYGQQINANTGISGVKGFSETQYGIDLGTDHRWNLDADNQLYTGIFAGYGGADRQFHSSYNGSTDSGYGGLYATWLNDSGWYADVVAKGQYFRNDFTGGDHGKYDSIGVGFSVEFGRQFEFKDGWFAEPSVQVSYLHLMNDNYTTTQGLSVDLADADVAQFYGGARFGRNIKLNNSGLLQPYIKAGGLGQISSGNTIRADGGKWRPNLDGARAVIGAGVVWQLNADSQLHLDYEASFGEKYDKPWGLNFGYRYQF